MGTPQNPHHTHQELAQAGLPPNIPPPPQGGGDTQSGAQGVSGRWGWVHFRAPPEAELPLGLGGVPARLGGSPGLGGSQAVGTLWLPSAGPGPVFGRILPVPRMRSPGQGWPWAGRVPSIPSTFPG